MQSQSPQALATHTRFQGQPLVEPVGLLTTCDFNSKLHNRAGLAVPQADAATWVHAEILALIVRLQEEFVNPFLQNQGARRDAVGRMPGD